MLVYNKGNFYLMNREILLGLNVIRNVCDDVKEFMK